MHIGERENQHSSPMSPSPFPSAQWYSTLSAVSPDWKLFGARGILKVMLPDLSLAIRLQEIDNKLGELTKEIAQLPRHIAEIEKKLHSHERKLETDQAALKANQSERKKCDTDIQLQEQKISKLKDQMLQAKTNDQYRA